MIILNFGIIFLNLLIFTTILFIYLNLTKEDFDKMKIIKHFIDDVKSLDSKSIIDESLLVLLVLYRAELSREPTKRWVHIQQFINDDIINIHKILPKLIQLGYISYINEDKKNLYLITYDGISLIEFNNILLFFYTKKIKHLFIIKFLLTIKINKNISIFKELKEFKP